MPHVTVSYSVQKSKGLSVQKQIQSDTTCLIVMTSPVTAEPSATEIMAQIC